MYVPLKRTLIPVIQLAAHCPTRDHLPCEEIVFHRLHRLDRERLLQGFGRVLENEPPRERRIVLFDRLDLVPDPATDVDEHDRFQLVRKTIRNPVCEWEKVEPAIAAFALTGHPEHKSIVGRRMLGEPFE